MWHYLWVYRYPLTVGAKHHSPLYGVSSMLLQGPMRGSPARKTGWLG
jgi:hypothetical protein